MIVDNDDHDHSGHQEPLGPSGTSDPPDNFRAGPYNPGEAGPANNAQISLDIIQIISTTKEKVFL